MIDALDVRVAVAQQYITPKIGGLLCQCGEQAFVTAAGIARTQKGIGLHQHDDAGRIPGARQRERLFTESEAGVRFLSPSVFRTTAPLPATAPVGAYDVEVVLLAGGVALARREERFDLVKSGIEQRIAAAARDWSLAYGLAAGALALISGWLASVIFRRD